MKNVVELVLTKSSSTGGMSKSAELSNLVVEKAEKFGLGDELKMLRKYGEQQEQVVDANGDVISPQSGMNPQNLMESLNKAKDQLVRLMNNLIIV